MAARWRWPGSAGGCWATPQLELLDAGGASPVDDLVAVIEGVGPVPSPLESPVLDGVLPAVSFGLSFWLSFWLSFGLLSWLSPAV